MRRFLRITQINHATTTSVLNLIKPTKQKNLLSYSFKGSFLNVDKLSTTSSSCSFHTPTLTASRSFYLRRGSCFLSTTTITPTSPQQRTMDYPVSTPNHSFFSTNTSFHAPRVYGNATPAPEVHPSVVAHKKPYALVAIDMDGTLLSSEHKIRNRTRYVLSKLLARGVHVIFATGRPFTDVYRIKRKLNIFAMQNNIPTPGVQVVTPTSAHPPQTTAEIMAALTAQEPPNPLELQNIPRCFAITSNGSCIYNEANQKVYENFLSPRACSVLYNLFLDDPDININIFRTVTKEDRQRANYYNASDVGEKEEDRALEEWVCRYPSDAEAVIYSQTKFTFRVVKDLEKTYPTDNVNCIFFLCYDLEKGKRAEAFIKEKMKELAEEETEEGIDSRALRVAPSAPYCLDVVSTEISKASALQHILRELNLTFDQIVTFGDGMNDIEMLSKAGRGFIMGNANQRVKDLLLRPADAEGGAHTDHQSAYYQQLLSGPDAINNCEVIGTNDEESVALKLAELFHIDLSHYNDDWDTESISSTA